MASFSVQYIFSLVDNFSGRAGVLAAAASRMSAAVHGAGAAAVGLGAAMRGAGLVVGGATVLGLVGAAKAAAKFEDAMANVRKVMPNMSKDEMWEMGLEVERLAVMSGVAAEKVAELMAGAARAGIRGKDSLTKMTEMALKMGTAWDGVNMADVAQSLVMLGGKFFKGLNDDELMDRMYSVGDAINYLGQSARGVKPDQMLKFFDNAGAGLARFGLTPEEGAAFASTALLSGQGNAGLNEGTRAASSIMRFMDAAIAPTKKQDSALKDLGLTKDNLHKMLTKGKPMDAVLDIMARASKIGDILKRQNVLTNLIGDKRAGRQLAAMSDQLMEWKRALASVSDEYAERFVKDAEYMDWMRKAYPEQAKLLEDTQKALHWGSVDQEFKARMDTAIKQSDRAREAWEKFQRAFGKPVLPYVADWFSGLAAGLDAVANWANANQGLVESLQVGGIALGIASLVSFAVPALMKLASAARVAMAAMGPLGWGLMIGTQVYAHWDTLVAAWEKLKAAAADPVKFSVEVLGAEKVQALLDAWQSVKEFFDPNVDMLGKTKDFLGLGSGAVDLPRKPLPRMHHDFYGPEVPSGFIPPSEMYGPPVPPGLDVSSIPVAVSATVTSDVKINNPSLSVQYNGPIMGPATVPMGATASRGTSTVESGAPAAAQGGQ